MSKGSRNALRFWFIGCCFKPVLSIFFPIITLQFITMPLICNIWWYTYNCIVSLCSKNTFSSFYISLSEPVWNIHSHKTNTNYVTKFCNYIFPISRDNNAQTQYSWSDYPLILVQTRNQYSYIKINGGSEWRIWPRISLPKPANEYSKGTAN